MILGKMVIEIDGNVYPHDIIENILSSHPFVVKWKRTGHRWKTTEIPGHIGNRVFTFIPIEGDLERWKAAMK